MDLQLSDEEAKELSGLLADTLGDLSSEIADTDNPAYGRSIRNRRSVFESIAKKLD